MCSSRGNCTSDENCVCDSEFSGEKCQISQKVVVATALVSTFAAGWLIILIIGIIVVVAIVVFCCGGGGITIGAVAVDVRKREKLKAKLNRVDMRDVTEAEGV